MIFSHNYFSMEDKVMKVQRYAILASLLMGLTNVSFAATYNPDQLAQFNMTNQCYNCDLSGATLTGNHSNAVFSNTNLTGAKGSGTFSLSNFSGSNLSSSNWNQANLSYAQLTYIPLVNTNFSGANLSYANFEGALTANAVFDGANLYGANISQQQLDNAASYCWAILPNGTRKNC